MTSTATLCLGANCNDAGDKIADAIEMLKKTVTILSSTPTYLTAPEYAGDTAPYLNKILEITTTMPSQGLAELIKNYQTQVRQAENCHPLVAIDIDIVIWNGKVMRPTDFSSQYFKTGINLLKKQI